jgi:hypothetical protein
MKKSILIYCLLFAKSFFAQVGINTTNPNAQLEIKSSDQANPVNTDGILIPKVDVFPAMNPTIDQEGMLVYLTTDVGANLKGFYYWDNTNSVWKSISGDKGWGLTGNIGTDAATNFIGTTDNVGLKFKVNNLDSGHLDPILFNTSFGMKSANNITTGYRNSAIGHQSLFSNTEGYYNSAVGFQSMYYNTTGSDNSSFGALSLLSNTTGKRNNAFGVATLSNNITGFDNVALGYYSMVSNITGYFNTAIGSKSLFENTDGSYNTSCGYSSLYYNTNGSYNSAFGDSSMGANRTGNNNSAFGSTSMLWNLSGSNNSAFGSKALLSLDSGNGNSAFGYSSLHRLRSGAGNGGYGEEANPTTTTGWNNIGIGFHSLGNIDLAGFRILGNEIGYDNIAFGLVAGDRIGNNCNQSAFIGPFSNVVTNDTNVSNSTAIGNGALVFQDNMMRLGNSAVTRIETQVGLTVVSDGRYKYNVTEEVKGLDFIKKLRPVVYQYDTEKMDKIWMGEEFDTMVKHNPQLLKDYQKASQIRYSGFIAQEVETAAQTINYNFSGISKPEKSDGHYGLDYASFVVPIVKAVQELANENAILKKQIHELENKNKTIELRLQKLESN